MATGSSPDSGRRPIRVIAANPAADPSARTVPAASAAGSPPAAGDPTSSTSPAIATPSAASSVHPGARRLRAASASTTSTGAVPSVMRVATLTEVSATAAK